MPGSKLTRAMILAAGYGTRLKPLTDTIPKALIEYKGMPMIEHVISKLAGAGIGDITVNTHYLSGMIEDYFSINNFGVKINLSHEKHILGTGGGIKNSRLFLEGTGAFLVHNVDVVSDIDIGRLSGFHNGTAALASLAVKKRKTSRPLLADDNNYLAGRIVNGSEQIYRAGGNLTATAFSGVYVLDDRVFDLFPAQDNFDIIPFFLDMASKGEKVLCYDIGDTYWKDLGKTGGLES